MLATFLNGSQIVLAILVITTILLQARGSGLGSAFGSEGNVYRAKRGIEKRLFHLSIVFAVLFFGVALANTLI